MMALYFLTLLFTYTLLFDHPSIYPVDAAQSLTEVVNYHMNVHACPHLIWEASELNAELGIRLNSRPTAVLPRRQKFLSTLTLT